MKRFFKIFLIILLAFFTLGFENNQAACTAVETAQTSIYRQERHTKENILLGIIPSSDTAIVSSNNNGYEIYSYRHTSEVGNSSNGHCITSNNACKQNYISNLDKNGCYKSHNIFPILKNEIRTRAP